ncbi:MAG: hypothetical protein ABFD54_16200 [Armatimonadota bacterium]|nr:hypothetical protein [bacterium]
MKTTTIDEGFIRRVYKTSAFVWGFGVVVALIVSGWRTALGWTFGSAISFGTMWSLEWIIKRAFVPGNDRARSNLSRFSMLKLPIMALVLAGVVYVGAKTTPHTVELLGYFVGFIAGVVLTQGVIFLKVLGMLICEHFND